MIHNVDNGSICDYMNRHRIPAFRVIVPDMCTQSKFVCARTSSSRSVSLIAFKIPSHEELHNWSASSSSVVSLRYHCTYDLLFNVKSISFYTLVSVSISNASSHALWMDVRHGGNIFFSHKVSASAAALGLFTFAAHLFTTKANRATRQLMQSPN